MLAGRIASQALSHACSRVEEGTPLLEIAEVGERKIRDLGGQPAFPVNVSVNHHAAHYTSPPGDHRLIPRRALVKVDLGVHIEGYIADTARTIQVGEDPRMSRLVKAAEAGLEAAIATARSGIRVWEVSKAIEKAVRRMGARPIENLSGHSITRYNLHAGISVPSVAIPSERPLSPRLHGGIVVAIEPFTTFSSTPRVVDLEGPYIYGFVPHRNPREPELRRIYSLMKAEFAQLPFTPRWMAPITGPERVGEVLSALQREGCIRGYPVLGLRDGQPVAQAEHTLIIESSGCTVTTATDE